MSTQASTAYAELRTLAREAALLGSAGSLLSWDQETLMPPGASDSRAEAIATVSRLVHERRTSPRVGDLLSACEADPALSREGTPDAANIRELRRDYTLATKLPADLVAELARVGSLAQHAWKEARARSDFGAFAPWLDRMMTLVRRKAECYGPPPGGELYDALLDEYEPGMTARELESVFTPLRTRLSGLIAAIARAPRRPDPSRVRVRPPVEAQRAFGGAVLEAIGFDLGAGRLDISAHPFCSGIGPGDVRLTTRYTSNSVLEPLYGTLHEGGHGLYEQGLPKGDRFGEPLGEAVSLGIHESQSRLWENFVGRSRAFWTWALPVARRVMAPALDALTVDEAYAAANTVTPSFIRVEADEATYNLHIMLRFELERALLSGRIRVSDVPGEWRRLVRELLGLEVPDDARGCLQDVHWSAGLVGYFPTYTLGNLYAAQFWERAHADLPGLEDGMARGAFTPLRDWLRAQIHAHGRRYRARDLVRRVTGAEPSHEPLLRHLEGKLRPLYGL